MKCYLLKSPTGIDALEQAERPTAAILPGQVLVRVRACSLNYRDLAIAVGRYAGAPARNSLVPLSDGAGEIVEVGSRVARWKPGDRVAGCFFQRWTGGEAGADTAASALGGAIDGMLAQYVALEQDGVVAIPEHLSFEEAATLPCAAVTAWHALVGHAGVKAGDIVLVQGTGGVSIFALQLAHAFGARVIVISSSDLKLERARSMGASDGINYKTRPEWDAAVRELTAGRGVDQVIEVGGAGTFARSLAAIRVGGRVSLIGVLSGMAEVNPMLILQKRANVQGISVGSTQYFEAMNRAITVNKIRPVIDRVFAFEDTKAAYRHLQSAAHFGKIVIRID